MSAARQRHTARQLDKARLAQCCGCKAWAGLVARGRAHSIAAHLAASNVLLGPFRAVAMHAVVVSAGSPPRFTTSCWPSWVCQLTQLSCALLRAYAANAPAWRLASARPTAAPQARLEAYVSVKHGGLAA